MMMGMAGGPGPFTLATNQASYGGLLANGVSILCTITAEALVNGGFPPYTYDWTDNSANVFVQASASATTMIRSTGTNVQNDGSLILVVTQANGVATTVSAAYSYIHGTP